MWLRLTPLALLLVACGAPDTADGDPDDSIGLDEDDDGGVDEGNTQFGEEDDTGSADPCVEVGSSALQLADETPWGVTVAEVMGALSTPRTATATRRDTGATTALTVVGESTGTVARWIDREGGGACEDALIFDGHLALTDTEGWFSEGLSGEVEATAPDDLSLSVDIDALNGSLSLDDFAEDDETVTYARLSNRWRGEGVAGGLDVEIRSDQTVGFGEVVGW